MEQRGQVALACPSKRAVEQPHPTHLLNPPPRARAQVDSLEDMRRFVMEHSDFSRAQGVVSKHVNVMSALSEQIGSRHLMDVSTVRGEGCGALLRVRVCVRAGNGCRPAVYICCTSCRTAVLNPPHHPPTSLRLSKSWPTLKLV